MPRFLHTRLGRAGARFRRLRIEIPDRPMRALDTARWCSTLRSDIYSGLAHSTARHHRMMRPRIVIVGAGFGGLFAAQALARVDAEVTVVDRHNYHLFQ